MSGKSFKKENNPALQFINTADSAKEDTSARDSVPMKRNPLYIETKSKRLQLLMQPSLYNKLKEAAREKGTSVNDLIHTLLEQCAGDMH